MLTSKNVSPQKAAEYFLQGYYQEGKSRWFGLGAENLGLVGAINNEEVFKNIVQGKSPDGTRQLTARNLKSELRRAALDCTFEAPKSISLTALPGGDEALVEAHVKAVQEVLALMEQRCAHTRVTIDKTRQLVNTGNLVVAQFDHIESRELDPHLHTHCLVMNMVQTPSRNLPKVGQPSQLDYSSRAADIPKQGCPTLGMLLVTPDGKWYSHLNDAIVQNKKYWGMVYQQFLAALVQKLGYEIEWKGHGQFELKGYTEEERMTFSKRRQQILDVVGPDSTWAEREKAWSLTRRRKESGVPDELIAKWRSEAELLGIKFVQPKQPHVEQEVVQPISQRLLDDAIRHCSEREVVLLQEDLEKFVLESGITVDPKQLGSVFHSHPELICLDPSKMLYTTQSALWRDRATVMLMQQGQGAVQAVAHPEAVEAHLEQTELNAGQRQAVLLAATTTDQFIVWQGVAGSGKTWALKELKAIASAQGYTVKGFGITTDAEKELSLKAGVEATTVASKLCDKQPDQQKPNQIWFVDESGMLSAKDCYHLLQRAVQEEARVVLVGDTRQFSAVEAGNPFKLLQLEGIKTAYLEESKRQQNNPELKAAVDFIAQGNIDSGFTRLQDSGRIVECDASEQAAAIVAEYMKIPTEKRAETLVLVGTHKQRLEITQAIRDALIAEGSLGQQEAKLSCLTSIEAKSDMSKVKLEYTHNFELGNVVIPTRDYKRRQLEKGVAYEVVGKTQDELHLKSPDGKVLTVDPCFDKSVYRQQEIEIASGDRLRWTRLNRKLERYGRDELVVTAIDGNIASINYVGSDRTETIDLSQPQHLDYTVVRTNYSAQGQDADTVLIAADFTVSSESFYVAVSRAKQELKLFTQDSEEMVELAKESRANSTALDEWRKHIEQQMKAAAVVKPAVTTVEQPQQEHEAESFTPPVKKPEHQYEAQSTVAPPIRRNEKTPKQVVFNQSLIQPPVKQRQRSRGAEGQSGNPMDKCRGLQPHGRVVFSSFPSAPLLPCPSASSVKRPTEQETDMAAIMKAQKRKLPDTPEWLAAGKRLYSQKHGWGEVEAVLGPRLIVKLDTGLQAHILEWPDAIKSKSVIPEPAKAFWIPNNTSIVPSNIESAHWRELAESSAIHPKIVARNFKSLQQDPLEWEHEAWSHLMYSDKLERSNTGRLSTGMLNRYAHIDSGGWWCGAGVEPRSFKDLQSGQKPKEKIWGCFKPNTPRESPDKPGKLIKYEHPPKTDLSIFLLNVTDEIADRIYKQAGVEPPKGDRTSGFWYCVWKHNLPVTITEGAKKAACLLSQGHATIGLPGIYAGYRSKDEQGNEIKAHLHEELAVFATLGREIRFCFDHETKPKTQRNIEIAISRTGSLLERLGAKVSVISLPGPEKGVDDLIVQQGALAYEKLDCKALRLKDWRERNKEQQRPHLEPPKQMSIEERQELLRVKLAEKTLPRQQAVKQLDGESLGKSIAEQLEGNREVEAQPDRAKSSRPSPRQRRQVNQPLFHPKQARIPIPVAQGMKTSDLLNSAIENDRLQQRQLERIEQRQHNADLKIDAALAQVEKLSSKEQDTSPVAQTESHTLPKSEEISNEDPEITNLEQPRTIDATSLGRSIAASLAACDDQAQHNSTRSNELRRRTRSPERAHRSPGAVNPVNYPILQPRNGANQQHARLPIPTNDRTQDVGISSAQIQSDRRLERQLGQINKHLSTADATTESTVKRVTDLNADQREADEATKRPIEGVREAERAIEGSREADPSVREQRESTKVIASQEKLQLEENAQRTSNMQQANSKNKSHSYELCEEDWNYLRTIGGIKQVEKFIETPGNKQWLALTNGDLLVVHHWGEGVNPDHFKEAWRDADHVVCCHPEFLPSYVQAKHPFPNHVGEMKFGLAGGMLFTRPNTLSSILSDSPHHEPTRVEVNKKRASQVSAVPKQPNSSLEKQAIDFSQLPLNDGREWVRVKTDRTQLLKFNNQVGVVVGRIRVAGGEQVTVKIGDYTPGFNNSELELVNAAPKQEVHQGVETAAKPESSFPRSSPELRTDNLDITQPQENSNERPDTQQRRPVDGSSIGERIAQCLEADSRTARPHRRLDDRPTPSDAQPTQLRSGASETRNSQPTVEQQPESIRRLDSTGRAHGAPGDRTQPTVRRTEPANRSIGTEVEQPAAELQRLNENTSDLIRRVEPISEQDRGMVPRAESAVQNPEQRYRLLDHHLGQYVNSVARRNTVRRGGTESTHGQTRAGVGAIDKCYQQAGNRVRNTHEGLAALADQVRSLPLEDVAARLGLEPDKHDKHKWRGEGQIVSITEQKFYDHLALKGGYGAIDLVMHIQGQKFTEAVCWLSSGASSFPPPKQCSPQSTAPTELKKFQPPVIDDSKWALVREYLTEKRQLPTTLVDKLHSQGIIYADAKQNAVFIRQDMEGKRTGASLRGTYKDSQFKGLATGSRRDGGWFAFTQGEGQLERIVLTESPIDALSAAALAKQKTGTTLFLSTDGAGSIPTDFLRRQLASGKQILVANDADAAGEALAQKVLQALPTATRIKPSYGKDWNERLIMQQEAQATAFCVKQMFHLLRDVRLFRPDGSRTFSATKWRFDHQENIVTITDKQDNREFLRVEGDTPITFSPTPAEREKLKDFREQINRDLEQQQQLPSQQQHQQQRTLRPRL